VTRGLASESAEWREVSAEWREVLPEEWFLWLVAVGGGLGGGEPTRPEPSKINEKICKKSRLVEVACKQKENFSIIC
jgi:hypothetical protein